MKSQDQTSRSRRPYGRTRRSHAPKRVASRHYQAAKTRPKPRFRGNLALSIYQFSWRSLSGTLSPSAPINIPAGAAERASREKLGFFFSFSKILQSCNFISKALWKEELVFGDIYSNKGYLFCIFNSCQVYFSVIYCFGF